MSITHLTQENYAATVSQPGFIFIDFSAEWCPPCKVMKPIFEAFAEDKDLKHIAFSEVDIDAQEEIQAAYNVSSIPTFVLLETTVAQDNTIQMREVRRWIGAQTDPLAFKTQILESAPQSIAQSA